MVGSTGFTSVMVGSLQREPWTAIVLSESRASKVAQQMLRISFVMEGLKGILGLLLL